MYLQVLLTFALHGKIKKLIIYKNFDKLFFSLEKKSNATFSIKQLIFVGLSFAAFGRVHFLAQNSQRAFS